MKRMRSLLAAAGLALTLALAGPAHAADPTPADRETVRALLAEGDRLYADKDYTGALRAYAGATAIIPVPTTAIEVARMQEALGLLVEARDGYLRVMRMPVAPSEPAPFAAARTEAAELASKIAGRIPSVVIVIDGAPAGQTPTVSMDGSEIPAAAVSLPRKVNPGKHTVLVKLAGYKDATSEVLVGEAETRETRLSLALDPNAQVTPPLVVTTAPVRVDAPLPPEPVPPSTTLSYVGFGAAAVGFAVGATFGLMSLSRASSAREHCGANNHCTPDAQPDKDASITLANVSNVGFGVALVGLGLGIYALVTQPKSAPRAGLVVTPLIGLGAAGLCGTF